MLKKLYLPASVLLFTIIMFYSYRNINRQDDIINPIVTEDHNTDTDEDRLANSYHTWFSGEFNKARLPGAAVAIVDGDHTWLKAYGVRNTKKNDPVDEHTVFRLGSVSKGFASVIAGILVQDSVFDWDDKVLSYLPDLILKDTLDACSITVRHVLSHTTGLPMHTFTNLLDYDVPYGDIIDQLSDISIIAPPGSIYSYQNVAYSLVSDIIESTTHEFYDFLMDRRLFNPAGMHDASQGYLPMLINPNVAYPHVRIDSITFTSLRLNERYYSVLPASGVNASITDMAEWLRLLLGQKPEIIGANTLSDIYTPYIDTPIRWRYQRNWKKLGELHYALGWRVFEYAGHTIMYHGGYVKGYRAEIAFSVEHQVGIAVLFNSSSSLANKCIPAFFERYFIAD